MRRLLTLAVVALVAGCFNPKYAENLECSTRNTCPPGFGCNPQRKCQRNFTPDAGFDAIVEKSAAETAPEAPPSTPDAQADADATEDSSSPDVVAPDDAPDAGQTDASEAGGDAPTDKAGTDAADASVEKVDAGIEAPKEAGMEASVDLGVEVGPPPGGLIGRWALGDEYMNGDTVPDLATADGAQNGVIIDHGAYMSPVKDRDLKANQALQNAGDDALDDQFAYIKVAGLTSLPQSVTISAWVAFTLGNGNGLIAGLTHGPQIYMKDYYATLRVPLDSFNYDDVRAPSSLPMNKFVHVAGVVSPSGPSNWRLELYINGNLAMSKTVANSIAWSGNFDIFGMFGCNSQGCDDGFKGWLDDVRVYNKALNAAEVMALVAAPTN
jgi:hypothetical protein